MRLISKGRVTVYAYDNTRFLSLDRAHSFHSATPPDRVYELNTATIPALIRGTLPENLVGADLTWAVGLPPKVEQQISAHVAQARSGELHINRYEEVRHVPIH